MASAAEFSYTREREMLFKLIFKMQHEIEELHGRIDEMAGSGGNANPNGNRSHSLVKYSGTGSYKPSPTVKDVVEIEDGFADEDFTPTEAVATMHTSADNGDSARTLEDTERETIKKSLERNCGRRKKTAEELNISERTLYRKIKEYGLE